MKNLKISLTKTIARIIESFATTNDINSPSHYAYIEEELIKEFFSDPDMTEEDRKLLTEGIEKIYITIKHLNHRQRIRDAST